MPGITSIVQEHYPILRPYEAGLYDVLAEGKLITLFDLLVVNDFIMS